MSYNIIQKNILSTNICFQYSKENTILISNCLFNYLNELNNQINLIKEEDQITFQNIYETVNPYQYLLTTVPGNEFSISKVKPNNNVFFEIIELFQLASINDYSSNLCKHLDCGLFTFNNDSIEYYLHICREDCIDTIVLYDIVNMNRLYYTVRNKSFNTKLFDLLFFDLNFTLNSSQIVFDLLVYILIILKHQKRNGTTIIKMSYLFYKPIIDCIYLLSCLFEKIHFLKPSTLNPLCPEFYLVCRGFNDLNILNNIEKQIEQLFILKNEYNSDMLLNSIFDSSYDLPYIYLNKIEELNSIFGQQHLETLDQVINLYKNKSRDEKIDILRKNHINKCIQWCEKNELPHNKFNDKIKFSETNNQ